MFYTGFYTVFYTVLHTTRKRPNRLVEPITLRSIATFDPIGDFRESSQTRANTFGFPSLDHHAFAQDLAPCKNAQKR